MATFTVLGGNFTVMGGNFAAEYADNALLSTGKILLETGDAEKARYAFLQIVLFYPYSEVYEEAKYYLDYKFANER